MHVLYIHQHFATPADSLGTRSYEFARRLVEAGHSVTMLCGDTARDGRTDSSDGRVLREHVDGIDVVRIVEPYANSMGTIRRVLSFVRFATSATRVARSIQSDLVFATSTPLTVGIPGWMSARRFGVPFVFEVRDLWPELPVAMGVIRNPVVIQALRLLERGLYRRATRVVALAPGIGRGVEATGVPPARVAMIPNGADTTVFTPTEQRALDARFGPDESLRVVYCGHHGLANGLDAAIDAAEVLRDRDERSIRFVMIGKGRRKAELMRRCADAGLDDYFSWIDSVPKSELATLLPRMDVGLMPLLDVEAFQYGTSPNKFFDYLAAGLPVINNYPGWVRELIDGHDCGIGVPPGDAEALADALTRLRDDPGGRANMGRAARTLAETTFARDLLGERFVTLIEEVGSEGPIGVHSGSNIAA